MEEPTKRNKGIGRDTRVLREALVRSDDYTAHHGNVADTFKKNRGTLRATKVIKKQSGGAAAGQHERGRKTTFDEGGIEGDATSSTRSPTRRTQMRTPPRKSTAGSSMLSPSNTGTNTRKTQLTPTPGVITKGPRSDLPDIAETAPAAAAAAAAAGGGFKLGGDVAAREAVHRTRRFEDMLVNMERRSTYDESKGPMKPGFHFYKWLAHGPPLQVPIPDTLLVDNVESVRLIRNDSKGYVVLHLFRSVPLLPFLPSLACGLLLYLFYILSDQYSLHSLA
jgi:hypothetical protein